MKKIRSRRKRKRLKELKRVEKLSLVCFVLSNLAKYSGLKTLTITPNEHKPIRISIRNTFNRELKFRL